MACNTLRKTGKILNALRIADLSAGAKLLDHRNFEPITGCEHSGSEAGNTRTNHDKVGISHVILGAPTKVCPLAIGPREKREAAMFADLRPTTSMCKRVAQQQDTPAHV